MLLIKRLKPNLNVQTGSIRAELFVLSLHCKLFILVTFLKHLLFFQQYLYAQQSHYFRLDGDVTLTSQRRLFYHLIMFLRNVLSQLFVVKWTSFTENNAPHFSNLVLT